MGKLFIPFIEQKLWIRITFFHNSSFIHIIHYTMPYMRLQYHHNMYIKYIYIYIYRGKLKAYVMNRTDRRMYQIFQYRILSLTFDRPINSRINHDIDIKFLIFWRTEYIYVWLIFFLLLFYLSYVQPKTKRWLMYPSLSPSSTLYDVMLYSYIHIMKSIIF